MFELCDGASDPLIAGITPSLSKIATVGSETEIAAGIDTTGLKAHIAASNVLQYTGSLTTPPCAEGVTFMIVENPLKISVADFNAIKKVVKFNSRFTQNSLNQQNVIGVAAEVAAGNATMVAAVKAAHAATLAEKPVAEAAAPAPAADKPADSAMTINIDVVPAAPAKSAAAVVAAAAAPHKAGDTLAITEISGVPMATPLAGVVQRRRVARNSL